MNNSPLVISYEALKRLVLKAYRLTLDHLPAYYPTIDVIDTLLESEEFAFPQLREDAFKFFVMYLTCGFVRDNLWHSTYPGKRYVTADNIITYIFTPLTGKDALKLHVGTWDANATPEEKEDRQALFEYMQSLIMDETMYVLDTPVKPAVDPARDSSLSIAM